VSAAWLVAAIVVGTCVGALVGALTVKRWLRKLERTRDPRAIQRIIERGPWRP
jgi:hypothetical protein